MNVRLKCSKVTGYIVAGRRSSAYYIVRPTYTTYAYTVKGKAMKGTKGIAVNGSIPWHRYGVSLAIWDHTVLPATRHK